MAPAKKTTTAQVLPNLHRHTQAPCPSRAVVRSADRLGFPLLCRPFRDALLQVPQPQQVPSALPTAATPPLPAEPFVDNPTALENLQAEQALEVDATLQQATAATAAAAAAPPASGPLAPSANQRPQLKPRRAERIPLVRPLPPRLTSPSDCTSTLHLAHLPS